MKKITLILTVIFLASCAPKDKIIVKIKGDSRPIFAQVKDKKIKPGDTIQVVRQRLNGAIISDWTISNWSWGDTLFIDSVRGGVMFTEYRTAIAE